MNPTFSSKPMRTTLDVEGNPTHYILMDDALDLIPLIVFVFLSGAVVALVATLVNWVTKPVTTYLPRD